MYFNLDIDFDELKKQKALLAKTINESDENLAELDGILHLIDSIQDYAVDELGMDEEEVFNFTE